MTRLSDNEIAGAVKAAGFPPATWAVAVAVALAESGGNSDATNRNTNGSTDYGLFQINSVHADLLNTHTWADPVDNARMALEISSNGSNWSPWVAYTTGRYRAYLSRARRSTGSPTAPQAGAGSRASAVGLSSTGALGFADFFLSANTWLRLGYFLVGGFLIMLAFARATGAAPIIKKVL